MAGVFSMRSAEPFGRTSIFEAVTKGNGPTDCIELLLKAGSDVNMSDRLGRTALMEAAIQNKVGLVEVLIKAGADVNLGDRYGQTALKLAIRNGNKACVKTLIKARADVNKRDTLGRTALTEALSKYDIKCAKILIKAGADVNIPDEDNHTPLLRLFDRPKMEFDLASVYDCAILMLKSGACVKYLKFPQNRLKIVLQNTSPLKRQLLMLLYAAGFSPDGTTVKEQTLDGGYIFKSFSDYLDIQEPDIESSSTLMSQCRNVLREQMLLGKEHTNLVVQVKKLQLPVPLQKYLLFNVPLSRTTSVKPIKM